MFIELSYWEVEEAVINLLKEKYKWEVASDRFQGGAVENQLPAEKKRLCDLDGNSVISFFIEAKEEADA